MTKLILGVQVMLKKCVILLGCMSLLLLSGCDVLSTPKGSKYFSVQTPEHHEAMVSKIINWQASGVLSIQEPNTKPVLGDFYWQQTNLAYRIVISSPLGLYHLEMTKSFGMVTLWKNGTRVFTAKTPDSIMRHAMGWSLPISNLQYWIKGMPAPQSCGKYFVMHDQYGHLTALKQDGWLLELSAYKNQDGLDLPQVIVLSRPGFVVKIVIQAWYLLTQPFPLMNAM